VLKRSSGVSTFSLSFYRAPRTPSPSRCSPLEATLGFGADLFAGSLVLRKAFSLVAETRSSETFVAVSKDLRENFVQRLGPHRHRGGLRRGRFLGQHQLPGADLDRNPALQGHPAWHLLHGRRQQLRFGARTHRVAHHLIGKRRLSSFFLKLFRHSKEVGSSGSKTA
jgi:hypothetical protein